MDIYLPIAEMSVSLPLLVAMGAGVGMLSGLFGVGGGFLMTPLLIFIGIPPSIAVGSEASQILASSVSGSIAHTRRGNVDVKMGLVLVTGGLLGSLIGIAIFSWMKVLGQIDLVISLSYVLFLGVIGALMFYESIYTLLGKRPKSRKSTSAWQRFQDRLPFRMTFERSGLTLSVILPVAIGILVGILSAIMGVGGGFLMVPAMIYLLGMPTSVVVGTSLFQICFITAATTFMHATQNHNVDIVLAFLLIIGGVVGAQIGTRLGARMRGEQLRILLAVLVLGVCARMAWSLVAVPDVPFSLTVLTP